MTRAFEEIGGEVFLPQFMLSAACTPKVRETLLKYLGCKNSQPYRGFAAGEIYICDLIVGSQLNGMCPVAFGMRRVTDAELDCVDDEPIGFAELPDGDWEAFTGPTAGDSELDLQELQLK